MDIVKLTCLVDSHHGIYQGQELAEKYPDMINDDETRQILLSGPDHPDYMEVFDDFVFSYSDDRDFLTSGEGAPDLLLATPDDEAQGVIMDLADAGNKVAQELLTETEWKTREDIIWECADSDFNSQEARAECKAIREALKEALKNEYH